jgi:thiamine kinase
MKLRKIAEGGTAEVYSLPDGKVVKLYHPEYPPDEAEREASKAELAYRQGLPTPEVIEVLQIEGRQGIVFADCSGPTMGDRVQERPGEIESMAKLLAALHAEVHKCSGDGFPTTVQRVQSKIECAESLEDELKLSLQNSLAAMSGGGSMCHGDFHPGNVLLSRNGPMIVDWVDGTVGPPVADVARTVLLVHFSPDSQNVNGAEAHREMKKRFLRAYQTQYLKLRTFAGEDFQRWMCIMAGARLSDNVVDSSTGNSLLALAKNVGYSGMAVYV